MKKTILVVSLFALSFSSMAQDEEKEKTPFKENLFTGGSVSLAFYNNTFLVGQAPCLVIAWPTGQMQV